MIPLSSAQRRLWFSGQASGFSALYNLPLAVRLSGVLDAGVLEAALGDVVERHESLRTVLPELGGEPCQVVLSGEAGRVLLRVVDVGEGGLLEALGVESGRPFDLRVDLPLRATLFRLGVAEHVLLLVFHHVATDGWSDGPFGRDLARAYGARCAGFAPGFEPLPVQYADYTLWQRELLGDGSDPGSVAAVQAGFWRGELAGLAEELGLPFDRVRPGVGSGRGGSVGFVVSAGTHRGLVELGRSLGVSMVMVVQAGLAGLLSRLGAGVDVPLGTAVSGRSDEALDELVGFFVNTVVLRTDVSGDPSFRELVERSRETCLAAFANQDLPFEDVVRVVNPARSLARHPLFQVAFGVQDAGSRTLELPGLECAPVEFGGGRPGAVRSGFPVRAGCARLGYRGVGGVQC